MTTWILFGVAAIVLAALIVRLMSGKSKRRRAPVVFNQPATRPEPEPSAVRDSAVADAMLLSSGVRSHSDSGMPHPPAGEVVVPRFNPTRTSPDDSPPSSSPGRVASPQRSLFSDFRGIIHPAEEHLSAPDPEELPIADGELMFGGATRVLAQMLPESSRRKMKQRQDLNAAGYHSRASWLNLNSVRFVLAFLALAVTGMALIAVSPAAEPYLLAAVVAAPLLGWAVPPLLVSSKASERRADIERGLPDALDMLNMGVSQGLTVQSSLRRIGPEIAPAHPELAQELKIVDCQAQVGSLGQALQNFAGRMNSTEVTSFTSLLIQSEATGTSVSRALTDYSDSMRSTIRERADSRANAASFKLLFPTVLCLMPSVFMFLLGPAVVSMNEFFDGTADELLESRENAINSLDQGPRIVPPQ